VRFGSESITLIKRATPLQRVKETFGITDSPRKYPV